MEVITEGNVTISTRPDVRIGDESVEDLLRSRSTLRYKPYSTTEGTGTRTHKGAQRCYRLIHKNVSKFLSGPA
jgi:hypothetical protein